MARNGRVYTPARTRDYERLVAKHAKLAIASTGWEVTDGQYSIEIVVQRARYVGDLDNYLKAVSDGLNGIVWPDDAMVRRIVARFWNRDRKKPGVWVRINLEQPDPEDEIGRSDRRKADVDGVRAGRKAE